MQRAYLSTYHPLSIVEKQKDSGPSTMRFAIVAFALACFIGGIEAEKDDSYYVAGTGNPNTGQKMYWKDADNVLQDLSQFSSLYVTFHQCAWTWMEMDDDDNDVDENDYWYMGKIPPMGANVAFSLYGNLKGSSFSGCGQDSFINSFHTDQGFNVFVTAMYYAGVNGFSSLYSSGLTAECQGGYGVGCDSNTGFAMHTYSGNECNPQNVTGMSDNLSSLNSAMQSSAKCVKIYDSSSYYGYSEGTALELLDYSHACFYQDMFSPDGQCPDPYGKLSQYQANFHKGITESRKQDPYHVFYYRKVYKAQIARGKTMLHIGIGFLAFAALLFIWNEDIISRFMNAKAKRKATKKLDGDDDHGTEAINSQAADGHDSEEDGRDEAIEKAEGGDAIVPAAQTRSGRETFVGRTIEVCGKLQQTGSIDPELLKCEDDIAIRMATSDDAVLAAELAEATAAFDRMCNAGGDACVDMADNADAMIFASRSFEDEENDLLESGRCFDTLPFEKEDSGVKAEEDETRAELTESKDEEEMVMKRFEDDHPALADCGTELEADEIVPVKSFTVAEVNAAKRHPEFEAPEDEINEDKAAGSPDMKIVEEAPDDEIGAAQAELPTSLKSSSSEEEAKDQHRINDGNKSSDTIASFVGDVVDLKSPKDDAKVTEEKSTVDDKGLKNQPEEISSKSKEDSGDKLSVYSAALESPKDEPTVTKDKSFVDDKGAENPPEEMSANFKEESEDKQSIHTAADDEQVIDPVTVLKAASEAVRTEGSSQCKAASPAVQETPSEDMLLLLRASSSSKMGDDDQKNCDESPQHGNS